MITRRGKMIKYFKPSAIHIDQSKWRLKKYLGIYFPYGNGHWFMCAYGIPTKDIFILKTMFKVIPAGS